MAKNNWDRKIPRAILKLLLTGDKERVGQAHSYRKSSQPGHFGLKKSTDSPPHDTHFSVFSHQPQKKNIWSWGGGVCLDLLIILVFKILGPVQMWLLFLTLSPFTSISSCTKPPKMYPMGESWATLFWATDFSPSGSPR